MRIRQATQAFFVLLSLSATCSMSAHAAPDSEIEYLLTSIGSSSCTFIRNGTEHSAARAEEHLRMKYEKAQRHIANADEFISKLATASSWTGRPYLIDCPNTAAVPSGDWLKRKLGEYKLAN